MHRDTYYTIDEISNPHTDFIKPDVNLLTRGSIFYQAPIKYVPYGINYHPASIKLYHLGSIFIPVDNILYLYINNIYSVWT